MAGRAGCAAAAPAARRIGLDHGDPAGAGRRRRRARRRTARPRRRGPRPARPAAGASSSTHGRRRGCRPRPGAPARTPSAGRLQSRPTARSRTSAGPDDQHRSAAAPRAASTVTSPAAPTRPPRPRPASGQRPARVTGGRLHRRVGDQARVDRHHLVRAVLEQPGPAGGVHCVLHPGPPAEPVARRRAAARPRPQRVDLGRAEPAEPGQLLAHHRRLQLALGRRRRVLEVAAAAAVRPGERARRRRPGRATASSTSTASARRKPLRSSVTIGAHPLAGQRVPDEDHPPVGGAGHAVPAVGDRADVELERSPPSSPSPTPAARRRSRPRGRLRPGPVRRRGRPSARSAPAVPIAVARGPRAGRRRQRRVEPVEVLGGRSTRAATARWSPSRRARTAAGP